MRFLSSTYPQESTTAMPRSRLLLPSLFICTLAYLLSACTTIPVSRSDADLLSHIDDLNLRGKPQAEARAAIPNGFVLLDAHHEYYRAGADSYIRKTRGLNDDIYEYVSVRYVDGVVLSYVCRLWAIRIQ
jgi:hypothetical protein